MGAITEWTKVMFCSIEDRLKIVFHDLDNFRSKYIIRPKPCNVFNMFRMIYPSDVKVVMIGQSPYPGVCPVTRVEYAFGPAFLPNPGCVTVPETLKKIIAEASRDFNKRPDKSARELVLDWINQGVLLLNASMTLGVGCPKYLEDHSILWEEVMHMIIEKISKTYDPIFLLMGKEAFKFERSIVSSYTVLKVAHPVARLNNNWMGSSVLSTISNMMIEKELKPIVWI